MATSLPPPSSLLQLRTVVSEHDVRAVVSDLDGVLRVFDPSLWDRLDHHVGLAPGTAFAAILGHPFLEEVTRGRGTHAQWRERAVAELVTQGAAPGTARETVRLWAATPGCVDQEVLAQLQRFREQGLAVFVLTNGTDRVPWELDQLGLGDVLGPRRRFLLNTADLGAAKPDREAFARAHERLSREPAGPLAPAQVAFLDDSAGHVRGAEEFGWRAVRHGRG
ncbi:HAD family hydrolase [Brachybacterium sacelli]|uniref:Hydrolase of the HAD superfamily n=2 Tax=Brachybacterium sacelli TaxID=173364 RepID=A0ABS4X6R3_9MICO|nr:HAD family hydrolase [Brachybacterium sacelli]MBP2384140.1 putative hydrolase of the HAD superfamily [Brachybacterium sacelli]